VSPYKSHTHTAALSGMRQPMEDFTKCLQPVSCSISSYCLLTPGNLLIYGPNKSILQRFLSECHPTLLCPSISNGTGTILFKNMFSTGQNFLFDLIFASEIMLYRYMLSELDTLPTRTAHFFFNIVKHGRRNKK
jgi:hypothetical protein